MDGRIDLTTVLFLVAAVAVFFALWRVLANRPRQSGDQPVPLSGADPKFRALPTPQTGSSIFVCYRRDDSRDVTGRLYDRLIATYGSNRVFRDIDSIPLGMDFRTHVANQLADCKACLVVIGRDWLLIQDRDGRRRLDDPNDHVRVEIETALRRSIPVVPLLINHATMPHPDDLPESLQALAYRNGIPVRPDPDFHRDVDRLLAGLK
jgi:hypothetical protein